jgi:preprotein translocase subunit SecD
VFLFTKPVVTLLARTRFFGGGHPLSGLSPARLGVRPGTLAGSRPGRRRVTPGVDGSSAVEEG